MDATDKPPAAPAETATWQDVLAACQTLRHQFLAALLILAVFTLSLNLVLFKAFRAAHRQVNELDRLTAQTLADFNTNALPKIDLFMNQIGEFSRTHPDFSAILARYPFRFTNQAGPGALPLPALPPKGP